MNFQKSKEIKDLSELETYQEVIITNKATDDTFNSYVLKSVDNSSNKKLVIATEVSYELTSETELLSNNIALLDKNLIKELLLSYKCFLNSNDIDNPTKIIGTEVFLADPDNLIAKQIIVVSMENGFLNGLELREINLDENKIEVSIY